MVKRIWASLTSETAGDFTVDSPDTRGRSQNDVLFVRADLVAEKDAEIERLLALVDSRDDIIQGLQDENAALREGRQTPSEIKTLKDWRDAHAEIERLRKALDQAIKFPGDDSRYSIEWEWETHLLELDEGDSPYEFPPELAAYLREKEERKG